MSWFLKNQILPREGRLMQTYLLSGGDPMSLKVERRTPKAAQGASPQESSLEEISEVRHLNARAQKQLF